MTSEAITVESCPGKRSDHRILRISGRLTFFTPGSRFLEQVRVETAPVVILDLSDVSFCDSSGIGALMQIYTTFKRENRRLALAGISKHVRAPLGIAKVLSLFDVFATVEDAEETLS